MVHLRHWRAFLRDYYTTGKQGVLADQLIKVCLGNRWLLSRMCVLSEYHVHEKASDSC